MTTAGYERSDAYYRTKLAETQHPIPEHMHDGLIGYLVNRIHPGSFLTAVLSNDLREACGRADEDNVRALHAYVYFLYNYAPGDSWGSYDKVEDYLKGQH